MKKLLKRLLRFLRITKPIQLSKYDIQWIKLCKNHYEDKYPYKGSWAETLKPLFLEIYGWNPVDDYYSYLNVIFNKLLELYLKIQYDQSGSNRKLKGVFGAAFYKSISREDELPIERAIAELCGLISCNLVIENGIHRYYLNN